MTHGLTTAQVAMTGSAVQLNGTVASGVQWVILKAHPSNAAILAIGKTGVTLTDGLVLEKGASVTLPHDSLADLYAIGTAADRLCIMTMGSF